MTKDLGQVDGVSDIVDPMAGVVNPVDSMVGTVNSAPPPANTQGAARPVFNEAVDAAAANIYGTQDQRGTSVRNNINNNIK